MPVVNEVTIYNMAIGLLGGNQIVTLQSADENTPEAGYCRLFYPSVRRAALEFFPWSFASRLADMSLLPETGTINYPYRFQMPEECLYPVRVTPHPESDGDSHFIMYGRELWARFNPAWLLYVADINDYTVVPEYFISVLTTSLALKIVMPARNDLNLKQSLGLDYADAITEATMQDRARSKILQPKDYWVASHDSRGFYNG